MRVRRIFASSGITPATRIQRSALSFRLSILRCNLRTRTYVLRTTRIAPDVSHSPMANTLTSYSSMVFPEWYPEDLRLTTRYYQSVMLQEHGTPPNTTLP